MNGCLGMQVQKDDIRNNILEAATEEFLIHGYQQSSLRSIAAQAGITVGNVYSYFSGKDDLFEQVITPAWEQLNKLISMEITTGDRITAPSLAQITERITDVFLCYKAQFFILMNGSAGSKYGNAKLDITRLISRRIQLELLARDDTQDPLLGEIIAASLIEGFNTIFNHYGGDISRLKHLVQKMLLIMLGSLH